MFCKIVVLFALIAIVASKPSPTYVYGGGYGGYPVATSYTNRVDGYYGKPYVTPVVASYAVPVYSQGYGLGYGGYGGGYGGYGSAYGGYGGGYGGYGGAYEGYGGPYGGYGGVGLGGGYGYGLNQAIY